MSHNYKDKEIEHLLEKDPKDLSQEDLTKLLEECCHQMDEINNHLLDIMSKLKRE